MAAGRFRDNEWVPITGKIVHSTDNAVLMDIDTPLIPTRNPRPKWVPKSQIRKRGDHAYLMAGWLVDKMNLRDKVA